MANDQQKAQIFNEAFNEYADLLKGDCVKLPAAEFSALEVAVRAERRRRDAASPERKLSKMNNREFFEHSQDLFDAHERDRNRTR